MSGTDIAIVVLFIFQFLIVAFLLVLMITIGYLDTDHKEFKKGIRRMADAADEAFSSDRLRIHQIEKFIVYAFKLDEVFGFKEPDSPKDPKLSDQVAPPKKKGEFKN